MCFTRTNTQGVSHVWPQSCDLFAPEDRPKKPKAGRPFKSSTEYSWLEKTVSSQSFQLRGYVSLNHLFSKKSSGFPVSHSRGCETTHRKRHGDCLAMFVGINHQGPPLPLHYEWTKNTASPLVEVRFQVLL